MYEKIIFSGMQILLGQAWKSDQAVIVQDGKIQAIINEEMIKHHLPAKEYKLTPDHYLVPGFIDMHVHGANGHDVMDGTEEALQAISLSLAQEGVTGFLATTMTAAPQRLQTIMETIAMHGNALKGAALLGVHLEGPFIASSKKGAQPEGMAPDVNLVKKWQSAAKGAIKIMTLAPELPGALDVIKALREMQIIASIGHTNATYAETCAAIAAGCTQATHLLNGMREVHQREPGPVGAILLADNVSAEMIVDHHHLHPVMVELILRLKTKDRLYLITDAMRAKCLGDGEYELGGQAVTVTHGKATLADGTLAGSTLKMPEAVQNMVQFTQCSLADAIAMCTSNPARALSLTSRKGSIAVGKDADLVLLDAHWQVLLTLREGQKVFEV